MMYQHPLALKVLSGKPIRITLKLLMNILIRASWWSVAGMPNPKNLFRLNNLTKQTNNIQLTWYPSRNDPVPTGTCQALLKFGRPCGQLCQHALDLQLDDMVQKRKESPTKINQMITCKFWSWRTNIYQIYHLIWCWYIDLSLSFCSLCRMVSRKVMARCWKARHFYNQTSWWPQPQPKTHQYPLPNYEADTKNPQSSGNPTSLWKLVKQFWAGMVGEDGSKHNKTRNFSDKEQLCLEVSNRIFGDPSKIGAMYPYFFHSEFKAHIESNYEAAFAATVRYSFQFAAHPCGNRNVH